MPGSISGAQTHARAFGSANQGPTVTTTQAQKRPHAATAPATSSQPSVSIGPLSAADACTDRQPFLAQQGPPAFVKAKAFSGAKAGYVFKKGSKGLGYYLEERAAGLPAKKARQQRQAEALQGRSPATEQQQHSMEEEKALAMNNEDMQPITGVQSIEITTLPLLTMPNHL